LFSPSAPENEYADGIASVHIRGPLDHHEGFGDNYDAIRDRAQEAFEDEDTHTVVFKIDSPGGAVSGLLDTVRAIRLMSEASAKPSVAYVDERAFSAAYALASAFDPIMLPGQVFELVHEHRGVSVKRVRGYQAGLFLGKKAVDAGLADDVGTFDELMAQLKKGLAQTGTTVPPSKDKAETVTMRGYRNTLVAQLKEARQALAKATAKEKSALEGKVAGLQAALEAYEKTTEKHIEHHKTKESGDEDEDEEGNETDRGDDEEGDEEKGDEDEDDEEAKGANSKQSAKSKSSSKAKAGKSKARYDGEEDAASEEDEEEARSEDDEEEGRLKQLRADVTTLTRARENDKRKATLDAALKDRRITPAERKTLAKESMPYIRAYLDARPRGLLMATGDGIEPAVIPGMTTGQLPPDLQKQLDMAVAASGGTITAEQFQKDYEAEQAKRNTSRNGAV